MSLNSVQSQLSSLKTCQTDISTGMDIVSEVALDLVEAQATDDSPGLRKLEQMILECAKLDNEISCFVESVEQMITQVRQEPPDAMFNLKDSVKERFTERMAAVSDAEINGHEKVVAFRDGIKKSLQQGGRKKLKKQVEMVNPVKNKKCQHYYDQEAILSLIKMKQNSKKKCRGRLRKHRRQDNGFGIGPRFEENDTKL
ncbi:E3 SUMO-protein ligase NSE2 [Bagarius yarrelli]|uniref:E3 SUMO-protein ligase NSE2 n=1 Tax=Bagarius yarrelli TaxID=175774 RepID=A0A556VUE1_BAGYA|nr:E3 SUMO-protein ligase NSE2 [Bagarius yarrelli]